MTLLNEIKYKNTQSMGREVAVWLQKNHDTGNSLSLPRLRNKSDQNQNLLFFIFFDLISDGVYYK